MKPHQPQDDWQPETARPTAHESEGSLLSRASYALRLKGLQAGEWLADRTPVQRKLLIVAFIALLLIAGHFGLLPRGSRRNPGANQ